ncbi:MAG TPA: choice-of-anchor L domain-containing protein [Polyangiaceae bacterium]|jgi:hypothetical protein
MRLIHLLGLSAAAAFACGGGHFQTFDDAGNPVDDGGNPINGDASCPLCGVEGGSGGDGGGPFVCTPDPANYDIPGNNCDDDGDGIVDNPQGACDTGLPANPSATQLAQAIGLCPNKGDTWGVVSAKFTQGYQNAKAPNAKQAGALPKFGTTVTPRQGSSIGIISSGFAAAEDCAGGNFNGSFNCAGTAAGTPPPGYPKSVNGCPVMSNINNAMNVDLQIKVPNNAKGFSFDFNFYSGEWPDFVCTEYNDSFVAWLKSGAWAGKSGDFNISFDSKNNPINVNNGFFQVCAPAGTDCSNMQSPATCTLGESQLLGTGFDMKSDYCGSNETGGGATGWLTTTAPVQSGETIELQFMVWNTGDDAYDSSVLLDNWQWQAGDQQVSTVRPPN